jgi:LuxR family transcriptional regulator, maltose regulon positive regulatory protein
VVAPAGYGNTTLLSQSAEYNCQTFAWVSIDESDNDSNVFLTHVAEALDEVEPIDERGAEPADRPCRAPSRARR